MRNDSHRIIIFDGVCNLCNRFVQFIIKRDANEKFRFTPLQSGRGLQFLKQAGFPEGQSEFILYAREGKILIKSTAVIMILNDLAGAWRLFYAFLIIPKFFRDYIYNKMAKRRYKMFGRTDSCMVPTPSIRTRFLE